jgi:transmembrane sensor
VALAFVVTREPRTAAPATPLAVVARDYEQRVLDDGSLVELRRGAVVEVSYSAVERRIRLVRGEALFTVAKNPARPFIVRAGTVDVRALGTVFNVRLEPDSVEVLVTEGKVQVDDSPGRASRAGEGHLPLDVPLLEAGQRAVVSLTTEAPQPPAVFTVSPAEIDRVLAWQPKRLEFNDTPLAEVVTDFNRFNTRQLRLGDASLASLPIGGNFRSDNLDAFVRLLEASFGLEADRIGDEIVLYRAR